MGPLWVPGWGEPARRGEDAAGGGWGGEQGGMLLTWARLAGSGGGARCSSARHHARLALRAWLGTQGGEAGTPRFLPPTSLACGAGFG